MSLSEPVWTNGSELRVFSVKGKDARPYFEDLARLRIKLFREFPYLYEGSVEYEKEYLETYFRCPQAHILLVFSGHAVVGFSSSIPLAHECSEIRRPFEVCGIDLGRYLYLGEAMLEKAHRGQGILRVFFQCQERAALDGGMPFTTLMTVDRPDNHPLRPADHVSMDIMLEHFGYARIPDCAVTMEWPQVDTGSIELNALSLWARDLRA